MPKSIMHKDKGGFNSAKAAEKVQRRKKRGSERSQMALTKRTLIRWLESHDFSELPGKKTSHRRFEHSPSGIVITIQGKGRSELSKKHQGMLIRELERAGFDKEQVRAELS